MATAVKTSGAMKAAGPLVGVQSDPMVDAGYESLGLEALRPRFAEYLKETKMLPVVTPFPMPANVNTMMPETMQIMHEIPTALEPALAFDSFVKGCAVVAGICEMAYVPAIRDFLRDDVATKVSNGEGLPGIDGEFARSVREAERAIFGINEPVAWQKLLSFMWGLYWMLGYVQAPKRKRGRTSPLDFVEGVIHHWAGLSIVPE